MGEQVPKVRPTSAARRCFLSCYQKVAPRAFRDRSAVRSTSPPTGAGLQRVLTELYVTMTLDGTAAKNTQPLPESGADAFVVHQQMERFGIQVPTGSSSLALSIKGFDTNRAIVRTGDVTWSLAQGQDVDVTLVVPTP